MQKDKQCEAQRHAQRNYVIKGSIKKPMSMSRLGMVLQQQGFRSKRVGKNRLRGWIVKERDIEEINANRNIEAKG